MSFTRVSAILRSTWLLNKQWADAHVPLVYSFLKGDSSVVSQIMGDLKPERYMGDPQGQEDADEVNTQLAKNVFEVNCSSDLNKLPAGSIAYVNIDGPLFKSGDICSYGMEDYAELFYSIANAGNIVGVILDCDSPGGQVDGTATFTDAVKKCTELKPVIGFVDDGMACSAMYWVLSACTEIYCSQPTDVTGSIGVYCTIADWDAYYVSQGLPVHDVYAPQSTEKNIEYRESIAGDDTKMKADLAFIASTFISTVKANRKGKVTGSDWATGATYFAADALAQGLIDGIKSFDQVVFRTNRLINLNKNNMAFEKILAIAKQEAFAVVDEGFAVSEEGLNNIEAFIAAAENVTDQATQLQEQLTAVQGGLTELEKTISAKDVTIGTQASRITELEALVEQYGAKPSGNGSVVSPVAAEVPKGDEPVARVSALDDANHPLNQMADAYTGSTEKRTMN